MKIIYSLLALTLLAACSNPQKKVEEEVDSFLDEVFSQPDIDFENAITNFENKDYSAAAEEVGYAIAYINELNVEEDTLNDEILDFAVQQLENLQEALTNEQVSEVGELYEAFFSADQSISAYHLAIVENYYKEGGKNKEGLERLHRALIRLEKALEYHEYSLTDGEMTHMQSLREEIANAQRSSSSLFSRVSEFIQQIGERTQSED